MTWREKINKWANENEETLIKMAYYTVGVMVGTVVTYKIDTIFINKLKGQQVCCGGMREGSNDTVFDVYLKNDEVISWTRPFADKP